MNLEFTPQELVALSKALYYLKYICQDEDAVKFAGSPFIVSAYEKIYSSSIISLKKENNKFRIPDENIFPFIEEIGFDNQVEMIKKKIISFNEWDNLNVDEKKQLILDFILPMRYKESTLEDIIHSINQYYGLST